SRHDRHPPACGAISCPCPGSVASPANSFGSVRSQRKSCHNGRRWACLWSMLASDCPMVRVWKPKPIGKATLTAPWNLRGNPLRPPRSDIAADIRIPILEQVNDRVRVVLQQHELFRVGAVGVVG